MSKRALPRRIVLAFICQLAFSSTWYVIAAFTQWNILWIMQIPQYSEDQRFVMIAVWLAITVCNYISWLI